MKIISIWLENRWVYLSLVLEVVVPGKKPYNLPDDDKPPGNLQGWSDEELTLLIEEGRRQLDRQVKNIESLRGRSQWLFTTGLAVLAVLIGAAGPFQLRWPTLNDLLVSAGLLSAIYAVLGAAALMVVPVRLGVIDVSDLSRKARHGQTDEAPRRRWFKRCPQSSHGRRPDQDESILKQLASEYTGSINPGDTAERTRFTIFFEVAVWLLLSAACAGAIYLFF